MLQTLCLLFAVSAVLVHSGDSAPAKERKVNLHHHHGIVEAEARGKRAINNVDSMDPQGRALDQGRRRKHRLVERINEILQEQGRRWEDLTSEERHAMKEQIRTEERYTMKTPAKEGNKQMSQEDRQQARKEDRQQARKESRQQARKEQRQQARQEETDSQIKDKKEKGRKPGKKGDKKAGRFDGMTEELKAQLRGQIIAIRHDSNMSTLEKKEAIRDLVKSARQA